MTERYLSLPLTSTPIKEEFIIGDNDLNLKQTDSSQNAGKIIRKLGRHSQVEMDFNSDKMVVVNMDGASNDSDEGCSSTNESNIALLNSMRTIHIQIKEVYNDHRSIVKKLVAAVFLALYGCYFVYAVYLDYERALPLIIITSITIFALMYTVFVHYFGSTISSHFQVVVDKLLPYSVYIQWIMGLFILGGLLTTIVLVSVNRPANLISLTGFFAFVAFLYLFSHKRSKVKWRPVIGGFLLQFILALVILRWRYGYFIFKYLGHKITLFLSYTDAGSMFLFGRTTYKLHMFAFQILPIIIFFSCIISTLYYLGIMQTVIGKIAWVMRVTLGTTAAESLSAAGNIFVGQTEAPILVRPFLELMTRSELHAIMTGGFATIAGGVLAAYIKFGVPPEHLLCASVMNAPCALAVSKLFYPETEPSQLKSCKTIPMPERTEKNVLEAAAAGASASISLVANIAANLIAFLALLAFINALFSWFGSLVDFPQLSFQMICSYVFRPIAFLMGVDWRDAPLVGELIGTKTFLNEFVAYENLGEFIKNRESCSGPFMSIRSEVITTYALCGFANLSSIGIQLGGLGPMAPSRIGDLAQIAVRALTAGTIACFITASIAGILLSSDDSVQPCLGNVTLTNVTYHDIYVNNTSLTINNTLALSVF